MRYQVVPTLAAVALVSSCVFPGDQQPTNAPSFAAPRTLQGRSFAVDIRVQGEMAPRRWTLGSPQDDERGEQLIFWVEAACDALNQHGLRFDDFNYQSEGATATDTSTCGITAAVEQQRHLCAGHLFMQFAQEVMPTDIFLGGQQPQVAAFASAAAVLDATLRVRSPNDDLTSEGALLPDISVPPPDASDSATFALIAVREFQYAALLGARALDASICADGTLYGTVPADRDMSGRWLTDNRTPLSTVVTSATVEATLGLQEAAESAEVHIMAAAQAHLADDRDRVRAMTSAWRAPHDSRLEIANMYLGAPEAYFEQDMAFGTGDPESERVVSGSEYETCLFGPRSDDEERHEDIIRGVHIDINQPVTTVLGNLEQALRADHPASIGRIDASLTGNDFFAHLGLQAPQLEAAVSRLQVEQRVLGRSLVETGMERGVMRFAGTEQPNQPAPPGVHYLRSGGGVRATFFQGPNHRPTLGYGIAEITGPRPSTDYSLSSVYATLDVVASVVPRATIRGDVRSISPSVTTDTPFFSLNVDNLDRLYASIRDEVSQRLDLCVGQPSAGGIDMARVRLFGADDPRRFEMWIGLPGIECATRGSVSGVPCDESAVRVARVPTVGTGATSDGFNGSYLEWQLDGASFPGGELAAIPDGTRLFITERAAGSSGRRSPVAAFETTPGPLSGMCSRLTLLPAGSGVALRVDDLLRATPSDCGQPQQTCAGIPRDLRLPLEDELTEATEGADNIESSFAHYLREARNAADAADHLGELLVEQGLAMDERAELAADQLEALCGAPINPSIFPSDRDDMFCASDADCAALGGSFRCASNRCMTTDVSDFAIADSTALEHCLGDHDVVTVALGSRPWTVFRNPHTGQVCDAHAEDGSPFTVLNCPTLDPATDFRDVPLEYERLTARPLGLVEPGTGAAAPTSCALFSRFVAGLPAPDGMTEEAYVDGIVNQGWLDASAIDRALSSLEFQDEPQAFGGAIRGGRRWATTGSFAGGTETGWPCAPYDGEADPQLCAAPPSGIVPLRCGGTCGTLDQRQRTLETLWASMVGLATVSRAELRTTLPPSTCEDGVRRLSGPGFYVTTPAPTGFSPGATLVTGTFDHVEYGTQWVTGQCWLGAGETLPASGLDAASLCVNGIDRQVAHCPQFFVPTFRVPYRGGLALEGENSIARLSWFSRSDESAVNRYVTGGAMDTFLRTFGRRPPDGAAVFTARRDVSWRTAGVIVAGRNFLPRISGQEQPYFDIVNRYSSRILSPTLASLEDGATTEDVLHGLELACMSLSAGPSASCGTLGETLPPIATVDDLHRLTGRLQCVADGFEGIVDQLVLYDVPSGVADQLASGAISPTYPGYQGDYGAAVGRLRAQIESVPVAIRRVAAALRTFSGRVDIAAGEMDATRLQEQLIQWQAVADSADAVARCVESASKASFGAVATCAASAVRIAATIATAVIQTEVNDINLRAALVSVSTDFAQAYDDVSDAQSSLSESYAQINAILAELDADRASARRLAGRVMFLDRDETGREYAVNTVMRARFNTLQIRYDRAHERAIRLAYIARLAVEQRLGVDLSTMRDDLTLVPAPATWADGVCDMRGLDYSEIRMAGGDPGVRNFADQYVGDYVTLLEDFIESYRLDFPFHDGDDVAVISLRDDLMRIREPGPATSYNQLLFSIDPSQTGSSTAPGWASSCFAGERCAIGVADGASPFRAERSGLPGNPNGYSEYLRDLLGDASAVTLAAGCPPDSVDSGGACTAVDGGAWSQPASLSGGLDHLLSWYEQLETPLDTSDLRAAHTDTTCMSACSAEMPAPTADRCVERCLDVPGLQAACAVLRPTLGRVGVSVRAADGSPADVTIASTAPVVLDATLDRWIDACRWRRVFVRVTARSDQDALVGFYPVAAGSTDATVTAGLAAPQLEVLPYGTGSLSVAPNPFFGTDASRVMPAAGVQEDTDGSSFRSESHWTRGCEYVCGDGISDTCTAGDIAERSTLRCFYETSFDVDLAAIERGEMFPVGGFALGNFNYRIRDLAINIVGTGVRDCSLADSPSECYASGFIPYAIYHDPPFRIRNHLGEVLEAQIFRGRMHFAKALTAERYLTNPLSSADRALLTDYMRREFRGRTLDGHYRLRVYDAPGLQWSRVEDIQILLGYRYWTRFE